MTAVKSGNHIYVSGSGNTLASITSDIADTTFIEKTGTSPDVYTVKGGVARYLRIRNGGTLTIGDSADYSKNETLAFSNNVANEIRFYVDAGGELLQYGDTTIDFFTGTQRIYYVYLYGKVTVLGNDTYKPVWQNYQRIYLYENQNNDTYTNDVWHFEKMIIGSAAVANYFAFYFYSLGKVRNHIFKDILFDKTYGKGLTMYAIRISYPFRGMRNVTFENLDFNNVGNYPVYSTGGGTFKLKGCTFGTTTSWKMIIYGMGAADGKNTLRTYGYDNEHDFGQQFIYLEDCTFENLNNKNCMLVQYGPQVVCKDCTWEHDASDSIQAAYGGRVLMWSGNTFTTREAYDVDYDGMILWVYDLTLTVEDKLGNALEDAVVLIEQSAGKEQFLFKTDSNGKLSNCHDIGCALLTWKYQYGNSKTTNMELWSDSTNSTYHKVTVFKEGYVPVEASYIMSAARSDTIILREISNLKAEI